MVWPKRASNENTHSETLFDLSINAVVFFVNARLGLVIRKCVQLLADVGDAEINGLSAQHLISRIPAIPALVVIALCKGGRADSGTVQRTSVSTSVSDKPHSSSNSPLKAEL